LLAATCAAIMAGAAPAQAQSSSRQVRFLVPFTPGGGSDLVARAMQPGLARALDRNVVVENRPGGGGTLAENVVAKAAPDGDTIGIVTIAHAVNASLYSKLPYDTARDFTVISLAASAPLVLVVNNKLPVHDVAELIAYAKAHPGELNYASPGNGSPTHLSAEVLKSMAGIDMVHVPYKGSAPATTDLLGGRVQLTFASMGIALPMIKSGSVRALAVTTAKRNALLPDLPTIAETVPGYNMVSWQAIIAPAHLPPKVAEWLNHGVQATLKDPEVIASFNKLGYDATPTSLKETKEFVDSEMERYKKLVQVVGVSPAD
jgi:tripartite-type tricarboxylate transporter receptor subunit TctC